VQFTIVEKTNTSAGNPAPADSEPATDVEP
jgi:hypothetical protein